MRFVDTNVFLRALVEPPTPVEEAKSEACRALFRRVLDGEEDVTTVEVVVAEVAYVLTSPRQYGLSAPDAAERLRQLVQMRHLALPNKALHLHALDIWASSPRLDYEDALIVATIERDPTELYSYDTDFDRVSSIVRVEPSTAISHDDR